MTRRRRNHLKTGRPDVSPSKPSHIRGVPQGNDGRVRMKTDDPGLIDEGPTGRGTARRSTGINPEHRDPIDPRMPNLSPS